jgi:predicted PhzF superfamily epimerase YddE/YHI9
MNKSYPFYQVDAFTETKLGGNPCAVFLDADDMDDATMLAVAKELIFFGSHCSTPAAPDPNTLSVR